MQLHQQMSPSKLEAQEHGGAESEVCHQHITHSTCHVGETSKKRGENPPGEAAAAGGPGGSVV